jgi:hypothetical protein
MIFRILTEDGDKRLTWNRNTLAEIRDAKQKFNELVGEGMVPYKVDPSGNKTPEAMTEFDAGAEEIVFSPIQALAGG